MATSAPEASSAPRPFKWRLVPACMLIFVTLCYATSADLLYAVAIWPPFVWTGFGLMLCLPGARRYRTTSFWWLIAGWVALWVVYGEDLRRMTLYFSKPEGKMRITSLNCAGGDPLAIAEAFEGTPDVVLLQEVASKREIELAARKAYGSGVQVHVGPDAAIVTPGILQPLQLPRTASNYVAAIVTLPNQAPILVISLRLQPPIFRLDYWNPGCWREFAEKRSSRREEFKEVAEWIERNAGSMPVIAGGDYNTPPDGRMFGMFGEGFRDATFDSGYTAVNEFPLARIDQIWVRGLTPRGSRAVRTANSDHQMVLLWLD